MTMTSLALTVGLMFFASTGPLFAQSSPAAQPSAAEARWTPWLGCWQLTEESVDDGSAMIARLLGVPAPTTTANAGALVCVTPGADAGATMTTLVNNRAVLTETIVADGTQKPLTEPDCRGWQRAEWSTLGARLFASAEIACADQAPRKVSGMAMMIAGPTWIDIQMIESQGQTSLRARRYRRAADQKPAGTLPSTARQATAMPLGLKLSIADVKEASAKVAPETLQAALLELRFGFDLNGKRLVELDGAGVPRSVIDLMVALSFPQRFVVERPTGGAASSWSYGGFDQMWPYYTDPYLFTSYYAPFGYRYWGRYDPYYFQGPGFVIVNPGGGVSNPPEPSGEGRVVDGRGYTRVRRNEPEPSIGRTNGGNGSGSSTASSGSSSSGSSSSGSSSGVSSSGYSGGGGGGERTAQPRPPGGY